MFEARIRPAYQVYLVDPIAVFLQSYFSCSAQTITLLALTLGLFVPLMVWCHHVYLAVMTLLLSGYLDTLDGTLARLNNTSSNAGSVLDIISDRVVECAAIYAIYLVNPELRATPVIFMLISILLCITSFLVVGIFSENTGDKSFHYSEGLMERAEALLFFTLMLLFPGWFIPLAWLFCALVAWTTGRRLYEFLRYDNAAT